MRSHCQGNTKLEYNGGFRAQLQVITFIGRVSEMGNVLQLDETAP